MKDRLRVFLRGHKTAILATSAVMLGYLLMFSAGITCPIKFSTGISCPGCGMTRACVSALRLDLAAAFEYHPLWIVLPFAVISFTVLKRKGRRRELNLLIYSLAALMFAVYIYRMLFTESQVVRFAPQEGIVYRAVEWFISPHQ